MRKFIFILLIFIVSSSYAQTDLKIGTVPGTKDASSVLELASTTKGLLIPRITTAQMNAIAAPAPGLMVYNIDLNCLHFYFSGWKSQCDPANVGAWSILGNSNTTPTTNFLGTTNAQDLVFKTNNTEQMRILAGGNVGIGTSIPLYKLDVNALSGSTGNPLRLQGLNAGSSSGAGKDSILSVNAGVVKRLSIDSLNSTNWHVLGNSGTVDGTNFIGTTDNIPLSFRVNNQAAGRIDQLKSNTFLGYSAGQNNTVGTNNSFVGTNTGQLNTLGNNNTAIGQGNLDFNTTGSNNIAMGVTALHANATASGSVALGNSALFAATGGSNTAVGYSAGFAVTSGVTNTLIGYQSGSTITTGSNNITLGNAAQVLTPTASNQLSIGNWINGASGNIGIPATLKVGSNASSIGAKSILELESTTQSFVPPRMTTAQMTAITTPLAGSVIYNTDLNCLHQYKATDGWVSFCNSSAPYTFETLQTAVTTQGSASGFADLFNSGSPISITVPRTASYVFIARGYFASGAPSTNSFNSGAQGSFKLVVDGIGYDECYLSSTGIIYANNSVFVGLGAQGIINKILNLTAGTHTISIQGRTWAVYNCTQATWGIQTSGVYAGANGVNAGWCKLTVTEN